MTEEEIKLEYFKFIQDYTNNKFDIDDLPGGIKLALNQLIEIDPMSFNVTSEKLSDLSQTFSNDGNIPKFILNYLNPYRRLKSV